MRIGLVGVGPWGEKLASAFLAAGAEIVAHARARPAQAGGYGTRMAWQSMVDFKRVDRIVCAAPPDVALEVAKSCAWFGIPALITKPLMIRASFTPEPTAPLVVDYVRLWAPYYHVLTMLKRPRRIEIAMHGPTYRSFPALWDYGSHAFSMLYDLSQGFTPKVEYARRASPAAHDWLHTVTGHVGGIPFEVVTGFSFESVKRVRVVSLKGEAIYAELPNGRVKLILNDGEHTQTEETEPVALQRMVEEFMLATTYNARTIDASIAATRTIDQVEALVC